MSICDSEENRKKLAWLVPGYILLAWFFCVLFQPLGIHTPPSSHSKNSHRYHDVHDKNYEVIYLDADSSAKLCNNGILTLEEGSKSAMIIRLGRRQHVHLSYNDFSPFNCSLQVRAGKSLDGIVAVVEEIELREDEWSMVNMGHLGSSVCLDYLELYSLMDSKNSFQPKQTNKLCGSWKVIGNEGITSHGKQKNLIGYCYDRDLEAPDHSCRTNHVYINAVINSNMDATRRYNSNGLNIGKGDKGFSIVVTGYRNPKKIEPVPKKHNKPSVARMQTQWASGIRSKEQVESTTHKYANFLFPNIPKLFDLSTTLNEDAPNFIPNANKNPRNEKSKAYQKSNWDPERKIIEYFDDVEGLKKEDSGCSKDEFMCQVTEFSNKKGLLHSNRCIWKRLKCDYHQNCGFTYNNDEINCSLSSTGGGFDEGDTIGGDGGVTGNPIPWSISTMSLLIIIYLAIVLILVLVTMLLLRWHRALRTPLDVLNDSRYTSALGRSIDGVTTVASTPHGFQGHGYGELTITSTNLEAALAEVDHNRNGDIDGAIAGVDSTASGRTPGTVSIMVMYRPQKSPKVPLAAAELPPSYDSLFTEENPPNYSRIANTVNLPILEEHNQTDNENMANEAIAATDILNHDTIIGGASSVDTPADTSRGNDAVINSILADQTTAVDILTPLGGGSSRSMESSLPSNIESNTMASLPNESVNILLQRRSICENEENNSDDNINQPLASGLRVQLDSSSTRFENPEETNEDHCQCDCDHTNCNSTGNN